MNGNSKRWLSTVLIAATCLNPASAKDEPQKPLPKAEAPTIESLLDRLERVERELIQLKQSKGQAVDAQVAKVAVVASDIRLDSQYTGGNEPLKVLSAKITIFNLTNKTVEVPADLYSLSAGGAELKPGIPPTLVQRSFYDGVQMVNYANLKTIALKLEPGESGQTSVVFTGLSGSVASMKPLILAVRGTDGQLARVDLLEQSAKQAQITVERVGPRKSLGLVTIGGQLTGLGSWSLVSKLDDLVTDKVARVVVQFSETAPQPDGNLWNWLQNSAMYSGINDYNVPQYGQIPASIAEFHVVAPTAQRRTTTSTTSGVSNRITIVNGVQQRVTTISQQRRVHHSSDDAVTEALASLYQVLPRNELLAEIQEGAPQSRVAALANGGGRLGADDLPMILKLTTDNSVGLQKAAMRALRHFGEDSAIEALVTQARKNSGPVSDVAIESLAGSRFPQAHQALLELLKNEPVGSRRAIVQSLGRFARPIWADTLYGFVESKDSGVRLDALAALASIGHPKLVELLETCLQDSDKSLSDAAFLQLATREEAASEKIAVAWTLKHLEKSPPTQPMRDLLIRTKEQRAIPLLLKQIERPSPTRSLVMEVLSQVGDQTMIDRFVQIFDKVDSNEKRIVLQALQRLQSPAFRDVAEKALATTDFNLLSNAVSMLQQDGTPQAAAILVAAFKQPGDDNRFMILCNALSSIASPEARLALHEAAQNTPSNNVNRTNAVKQAIRNLQLRSPAQQHVAMARNFEENKQLPQAMNQLDQAVKLDPENPEARLARGNLLLKQDKLEKAAEDFKKFMELDPTNSQGPTSLAIILARQGKLDESEKLLEETREKFKRENLFLYNAACVYGRALEYTRANEKVDKRDERLKKYEQKAIDDIKAALAVGLDDQNRNWAKEDPDLKSLHGNDEFKKLILN